MRSLRASLVTMAALLAILFIAGAAILLHQLDGFARAQSERQLLDTTRAASLVIDGELRRDIAILETLRATDAVRRRDWRIVDAAARRLDLGPDAWITVGDRDGQQRLNTHLPVGARLSRGALPAEAWRTLDGGQNRACNLINGLVERQIVCVDVPIMESGKAAYHLTMMLRPRHFAQFVEPLGRGATRYATIVDRNGFVIWRNIEPVKYIGTRARPFLLKAMAEGRVGLTTGRSLDGISTRVAFSRSELSGWTFILSIPRAQIDAPGWAALRSGLVIAAILVLAALLAGGILARRIQASVSALSDAASRIGAGDPPDYRATGLVEIDRVGEALNRAIADRAASEERFAFAQELGGIGAWDWDLLAGQGHVTASFKEMHGLTDIPGPLTIAQVRAVVHPDDLERYDARFAAAEPTAEPFSSEYRVVHPDGSIRWIAAKGRLMFDDDRLVRAAGIVRDVTGEHEAEAELRRLNRLLEERVEQRTIERDRLWDISGDPFVISDARGVWLAASPAWTRLLGWTEEELVGRTSEWMEHPDDRAKMRAEVLSSGGGKPTRRFETRFRDRDGKYHWLSWTAQPAGDRIYSIARDVTAEREQAAALGQAEAALRQAQKMESIGHITGGVAHDFNNLLAPIVGALDLLQQRGLPDERSQRLVGGAAEAAERARLLVQRLLAFARRQPLRQAALDLGRLVADLRDLLATTLGPRIALSMQIADSLPLALGDANQLEMAILNIAVNARDAMPDGGSFTIHVDRQHVAGRHPAELKPGDYIRLCCTDTGVGMPDEVIARAIEPFFSTKGSGRGTGLGLSMVHGLAAQLGGGMLIDSRLGIGTSISLWLPVAEQQAQVEAAPAVEHAAGAHKGIALIVDDEPLVRASTGELLASLGYDVIEASGGPEALRLMEGGVTPDVVVTDHLMPNMTGQELARQLRARNPHLPILIISGYADLQEIALDLPRLAKPFTRNDLAETLARMNGEARKD